MQPTEPRYCPQVFDQPDLADAKAIILTPEAGLTTDERWERETAFLRPFLEALPAGLAIDYGCGIGRLPEAAADYLAHLQETAATQLAAGSGRRFRR